MVSTSPGSKHISLEITSDTICPFCYIGYKRIQSAISQCKDQDKDLSFSLRFSPFQLDHTLPLSPGREKRAHYHAKFGKERFESMEQAMLERGKADGITFSYGGRVSSTVDSHRLLEKAYQVGGESAQLNVVEALFKTYFEDEGDIGDRELLARKTGETGVMTEDEVKKFLNSEELKDEVNMGIIKARQRGISGVPFTIINEKYAVSGAQDAETFADAFRRISKGEM